MMATDGRQPDVSRDVRMRGFAGRTEVAAALDWIDAHSPPGQSRTVSLSTAAGRVLAENQMAVLDVPPFRRSAMDGYAVLADDTHGAADYTPLPLKLIGESWPGQPFTGTLTAGQAVKIMTGAPVPDGADAVVPAEYAEGSGEVVSVTTAVSTGKHVGAIGEDVRREMPLLPAGRRLRPQDVGLLASQGLNEVTVVDQPRVRLLITGNELAASGQPRAEFQIYDSNSSMLAALVERDGGRLESVRRIEDDEAAIRAAMTEPGTDVILVSGGSSVGAEDHAPLILAAVGELAIHGVAMRPSSPSGMGRIADTLVFLLPGNPVSCLCAYDFFAGRAIRRLGGRAGGWPYLSRTVNVAEKIVSAIGRVDYCRVTVGADGVRPLALSGASILSSTTRADGFLVVPAGSEGYAPGTEVTVYSYDPIS